MVACHDREWGVPLYDDRRKFEFRLLETIRAGLSWRTVPLRRGGYREISCGFDPSASTPAARPMCGIGWPQVRAIVHRA